MRTDGICPDCFAQGYTNICPRCGYVHGEDSSLVLPPGTRIGGYTLGRTVGMGGFGITYLAQGPDGIRYVLKEYFPAAYATRRGEDVVSRDSADEDLYIHGLRVFLDEADILKEFAGNPRIVQVYARFTANNTGYYAMEFLDGVNARGLARSMRQSRLPLEMCMQILTDTALALGDVHAQGLLHRDVSPENIFVEASGRIKLIDFGATRFYLGERTRSLSVILKPGFAPPEQYSTRGIQGPWTDIYALCASVYHLATNHQVPPAPERLTGQDYIPLMQLMPEAGAALSAIIDRGLLLESGARYQDTREFLDDLRRLRQPYTPPRAAPPEHTRAMPVYAQPQPVRARQASITLWRADAAIGSWMIPPGQEVLLGRARDICNIHVNLPVLSRRHCAITFDGEVFRVSDLSRHGLYDAQGVRLAGEMTLHPGDALYLPEAGYRLILEVT